MRYNKHVPQHASKPFWNGLLIELKDKAIFWVNLCKEAGKSKFGHLTRIMLFKPAK